MKRGTKIGWFLIALSVILSVWVIVSQSSDASQATESGLVLSDDGTVLEDYTGNGGAVTIPDGVTTINAGVFASKDITSVVMPSSVTSMGTGVFSGCTSLTSVSLSSSLNGIPEETFRECLSLGSVTIPDSATSIGSNAFYGCASLSSVSIPASVSSISTDAFSGCGNLSNISVASGNGAYASSDGCLYNASKTRLLLVPEGKTSLAIAAGTTTIGTGALQDCTGISTVSLPNSVTTIEANAFTDSGVETITIPASVTSIGHHLLFMVFPVPQQKSMLRITILSLLSWEIIRMMITTMAIMTIIITIITVVTPTAVIMATTMVPIMETTAAIMVLPTAML